MRSISILALIALGLAFQNTYAADAAALVETLKRTAMPGNGITAEEQEIAKKVQVVGTAAIPYLLNLLQDKNEDVRALASYTLSDMKGLTEQHLDALIESRRRGDGWIPPAIARIGTRKAVTFLVKELVRERQTQTQLTFAIKILGAKAIPELLDIYQGEMDWDDELERTMEFVFSEFGNDAISAIEPLMKIANDESKPSAMRRRAIVATGSIGRAAEKTVPDLFRLRGQNNEELSKAATEAILKTGTAAAAQILVADLKESRDPFVQELMLLNIARLESRGVSAGPVVVEYLNSREWNVRVAAARTLGFVGYNAAVDELIKLLSCEEDWRQVFCAAKSLGQLRAKAALPALRQCGQAHWYSMVRKAARQAVEEIGRSKVTDSDALVDNVYESFVAYERFDSSMDSLETGDANSLRLPVDKTQDELLTVTVKDENGTMKRNSLRGIRVEDGCLVGSDRGEWGGEISFIDSSDKQTIIAEANTQSIYKTKTGIIAVTGLAHLGTDSGFLFRLSRNANRQWTALKWRALPGAPIFSRPLTDGSLLISCNGGIVLVSPEGTMTSLTRSQALQGPAAKR